MIDTGEKSYEDRVSSYLNLYKYYEKITKIDYLILTHLDSDHIGSAEQIIENYNVKNVYRPPLYSQYEFEKGLASEDYNIYESELYDSIIKKAYQKNCNLHFSIKGEKIIGKDFTVEFLSPKNTYYPKSNNFSAVLMLSYNSKKYLFTGDAEKEIEEELIKDYGSYLKADVLKVGHHGSETSSSAEFLDMVKPEYAIVSSGNNDLPSIEVMDRLAKRNIKILSTSNIGSFALSDNKDNIVYTAAQKPKSYLDLILTIFILFIFVVWKNPFSKIDFQYFKNNTEKF